MPQLQVELAFIFSVTPKPVPAVLLSPELEPRPCPAGLVLTSLLVLMVTRTLCLVAQLLQLGPGSGTCLVTLLLQAVIADFQALSRAGLPGWNPASWSWAVIPMEGLI